ncbi:MAG: peptidase inhibitor family I36 protein, partial [Propionibacteriaceae bacterium]|nr:peptidase inhibitor family I36 protein [Propionibacteriaceae bacterium]
MKSFTTRQPGNAARFLLTAVAAAAVSLAGLVLAPQAQAATNCPTGQFCYYYQSNQQGSMRGYTGSVSTLTEAFTAEGAGKGIAVRNNSYSVWNNTSVSVTVYYSPNYAGASQTIPAGTK